MTCSDAPPDDRRSDQPLWPYLLAVPVILAAFHSPALSGHVIYFHNDLWAWFLPVHDWLRRELWSGNRLPWCPLVGCGYPLAAEPQTGVYYPLNLILALPLPIGQAMAWLLYVHYCLAGVGMFMLARRLRLERELCLLAGLLFTTGGFLIAHLHHVAIISAVAWFPWSWYALLCYRNRAESDGGGRYLLLLAWCSAAQLLAGQPQVWLLTVASGYLLLLLWEIIHPEERLALPTRPLVWRWVLPLVFIGLGAGVAGVTLLPMLSLYAVSGRSKPSLEFVTSYCLGRQALKTFLGSKLSVGDYWEFEGFIGRTTIVLALVGLALGRRRNSLYLLVALFLAALFMALAQVNPLYRLFVHLPLLSGLRCSARWLLIMHASLVLLAMLGLQALKRWRPAVPIAILLAATELFWWGSRYNPTTSPALLQPPPSLALAQPGRVFADEPYHSAAREDHLRELIEARQTVAPNLGMLWGVSSVNEYMPLEVEWFKRLREQRPWRNPSFAAEAGVRRLLTMSRERLQPGWRQIYQTPQGALVYDNLLLTTPSPEVALYAAFSIPPPPQATAVVATGRGVFLNCRSARPDTLRLAVTWLPWWDCRVNRRPAVLKRSGIAFCSVPIPTGESTVELRYRQPRLREGLIISLISLVLLLALLPLARRWS